MRRERITLALERALDEGAWKDIARKKFVDAAPGGKRARKARLTRGLTRAKVLAFPVRLTFYARITMAMVDEMKGIDRLSLECA